MATSSLKLLGLSAALGLGLAGCKMGGGEIGANNASMIDAGPALKQSGGNPTPDDIAAAKAAAEIAYCPRSKQHVTRAECKRVTEVWDNLEKGKGAIEAPSEMVREEASAVSFAVAGESSGTSVEEVLGTEALDGSLEEVKIGGVMAAELTGRGFKIEPSGRVRKEVGPAGSMLWEWGVTPLKNHGSRLRVQAFVIVPGPNGKEREIFLKTYSKDVKVKVTGGQRVADWMDETSAWFTRGNNWLKALAGLLTALGAVLVALKALRPKGKAEPPA